MVTSYIAHKQKLETKFNNLLTKSKQTIIYSFELLDSSLLLVSDREESSSPALCLTDSSKSAGSINRFLPNGGGPINASTSS